MSGKKAGTGSGGARKASGKKAPSAAGASARGGWRQVFESGAGGARVLNDWQVVLGTWDVTDEGFITRGKGLDGTLMFRQAAVVEAIRVEFEVKAETGAGTGVYLGLDPVRALGEACAFFGFGAAGSFLRLRGVETACNRAARIEPRRWHRIAAIRQGARLQLEIDGVRALDAPDTPAGLGGEYFALYSRSKAVFRRIRVFTRADDELCAYVKWPQMWRGIRQSAGAFDFYRFSSRLRDCGRRNLIETHYKLRGGFLARPQDSRLVYGAGHCHTAMPSMIRRRAGDFLAAASGMRAEYDSPDGKIVLLRSADGLRWSRPETLAESVLDCREPGLVELTSGRLLLTWTVSDGFLDPEILACYPHWVGAEWKAAYEKIPVEQRRAQAGYWRKYSDDGGKNWSAAARLPLHAPHGPAELSAMGGSASGGKDGRLLLFGRGVEGKRAFLGAAESIDRGESWRLIWSRELPDPKAKGWRWNIAEGAYYNNGHVIELPDGKLLALVGYDKPAVQYRGAMTDIEHAAGWYSQPMFQKAYNGMGYLWQTESADGGKTWSHLRMTDMYGNWPQLLALADGRLLCTYAYHGLPLGSRACLSFDGGRTWETDHEIVLRADNPRDLPSHPTTASLAGGHMLTLAAQGEALTMRSHDRLGREPLYLQATEWRLPALPERVARRTEPGPRGDEPFMDQQAILGGDGRRINYRIPTLVATPKGTLLAFANRRLDSREDYAREKDIVMRRSTDGGRTWAPPVEIFAREGWRTIIGGAVVSEKTGRVLLSYTREYGLPVRPVQGAPKAECGEHVAISDDDGLTWRHERIVVRPSASGAVRMNTHGCSPGLTLRVGPHAGRLILPCHADYGKARATVVYSDDDGATWTIGGRTLDDAEEPVAVETSAGALVMSCRTDRTAQTSVISRDGGLTFQQRAAAHLADTEGGCHASMCRYSHEPGDRSRILLFGNPVCDAVVENRIGSCVDETVRRRFTVRVSYDEGKTWPVARVLWNKEAGYSAMAVLPDGAIVVLFERGEFDWWGANQSIAIARFNLAWIEKGFETVGATPERGVSGQLHRPVLLE